MLSNCGAEEESWESLDRKEIKPVNPKGNQSWIFIGRTDAKTEAPILWPPEMKNWLIGKDPDAGKDWRQEKGMTEDEMVEWHHRLDGHGLEQALGIGDGQGNLACYSPGVAKSQTQLSDWTEMNLGPNSTVHFQPINLANCNVVTSVNTPPACVKHPVSLDPENTILSEFYVSLSGGHKMVSCC